MKPLTFLSEAPGKAIFWLPNLLFPPQPDLSSMPVFPLWICPVPEPAPAPREIQYPSETTVCLFICLFTLHHWLNPGIVLNALTYASLATIADHYSSVGRKGLAKMSFQMAGKPGSQCQQLLIHRAVLAKNRELRHSWMLVCQAKRQGSCAALSLSSCRSASLPHTQAEKALEVSRSSPCSCVLTLSALFSPSHLHNSHITTRLTLIYTSSPLTPSLSDSLAAVFLLSFFFLFYCPPYSPPTVGNWYSSNSTPTSFLCLSLCGIVFMCFSHFQRGPGFVFEHGVIGKFDFTWQRTDCIV